MIQFFFRSKRFQDFPTGIIIFELKKSFMFHNKNVPKKILIHPIKSKFRKNVKPKRTLRLSFHPARSETNTVPKAQTILCQRSTS